jgi:phage shock protein A
MSGITRCILRYGVIGGIALGGITLLVGPERVAAGLSHVRAKAQTLVDSAVDDPMALRRQLEQLADEYPDRIAEVRGEVAEVEHQIAQFERDVDIAKRVVAMSTDDLQNLKTLVARAEVAESTMSHGAVAIRYEGVRFDIDEAYTEGKRINHVRNTYEDRLAHDEVQLKFLEEQNTRLGDILEKLEDDFNTYQSQLWQLDRQIDAIQRNERLIELTEAQQATLQSYDRFGKVQNLKQLEAKLAELRATQQAQLEYLSKRNVNDDYEKRARYELDTVDFDDDPFGRIFELDEDDDDDEDEIDRSIAFAPLPIIIETE